MRREEGEGTRGRGKRRRGKKAKEKSAEGGRGERQAQRGGTEPSYFIPRLLIHAPLPCRILSSH